MDIDGHAGTAAKVLGAVFGRSAVTNSEYAGIGISLLDGGMSYEQLMGLAINARLGASASHREIVEFLYTNVVGVGPSLGEREQFEGLLGNGTFSVAALGVLAADTDLDMVVDHLRQRLNQSRIVLVGHSWGGALGLLYSHQHPDKVSALFAVNPLVASQAQQQMRYTFLLHVEMDMWFLPMDKERGMSTFGAGGMLVKMEGFTPGAG